MLFLNLALVLVSASAAPICQGPECAEKATVARASDRYVDAQRFAEAGCAQNDYASCDRLVHYLSPRTPANIVKDEPRMWEMTRKAVRIARELCAADDAGCTAIGEVYLDGNGLERDEAKALPFLKRACAAQSAKACTGLATIVYYCNDDMKYDKRAAEHCANLPTASAKTLFERACAGGDPMGCMGRAMHPSREVGVKKGAARWNKKACALGSPNGCFREAAVMLDVGPKRAGLQKMKRFAKTTYDTWHRRRAELAVFVAETPTKASIAKKRTRQNAVAQELCGERASCYRSIADSLAEGSFGLEADETLSQQLSERACDLKDADACATVEKMRVIRNAHTAVLKLLRNKKYEEIETMTQPLLRAPRHRLKIAGLALRFRAKAAQGENVKSAVSQVCDFDRYCITQVGEVVYDGADGAPKNETLGHDVLAISCARESKRACKRIGRPVP